MGFGKSERDQKRWAYAINIHALIINYGLSVCKITKRSRESSENVESHGVNEEGNANERI